MRRPISLLMGALLGGVIGLGSMAAQSTRFDLGAWGVLPMMLSLPGAFVAVFLGLFEVLGTIHGPNEIVIAVVDVIFYAWLVDFIVARRRKRAR